MNKKNLWLLSLGLGISSGTILVDRFIVTLPDLLVIVLAILAIVSFITYVIINRKQIK